MDPWTHYLNREEVKVSKVLARICKGAGSIRVGEGGDEGDDRVAEVVKAVMGVVKVVEAMVVVVLAPLVLVFEQMYLQVNASSLKDLGPTLGPLNQKELLLTKVLLVAPYLEQLCLSLYPYLNLRLKLYLYPI